MASSFNSQRNKEFEKLPSPFQHDTTVCDERAVILLEKLIIQLLGSIKDKQFWKEKIRDEKIKTKYTKEMSEQLKERFKQEVATAEKLAETADNEFEPVNMNQIPPHLKMDPDEIIDYVIRELVCWSGMSHDDDHIAAAPVDGTYLADHQGQMDGLLSNKVRSTFREQITRLEAGIPQADKDYHPGSDSLVVDLVHPSLYCLVSGVTLMHSSKKAVKKGEFDSSSDDTLQQRWMKSFDLCTSQAPAEAAKAFQVVKLKVGKAKSDFESKKYQWLPCDVSVMDGRACITSYINNLHPVQNGELYGSIENVLSAFIPLFNEVLRDLKQKAASVIKRYGGRIEYVDWYGSAPEFDDDEEGAYENYYNTRTVKMPPLPAKVWGEERGASEFRELTLNNRDIQVIVKLANIELSPDKPRYPGGVWHVEGMLNENIVATGIYYYDIENITQSKLRFRSAIREYDGLHYEQNDNAGVRAVYGMLDEDALNQDRGFVSAIEGRMLAFPNIYQHRVEPFELADKSKPGHRKILVYFLIDPSRRILSTADVPPQQESWWVRGKRGDGGDWPMNVEQAKEHRQALMDERKFLIQQNTEALFERPFSLCEH